MSTGQATVTIGQWAGQPGQAEGPRCWLAGVTVREDAAARVCL